MMKKLFFTLTISFITLVSAAQFTFEKQYPFYKQAIADVVFTQDDGYVMAFIGQKDKNYFCLLKTDLKGDTLWTKTYDFKLISMGNTVGTQDSEGNMYVSFFRGAKSLAKFNPAGDLIWSTYCSNPGYAVQLKDNVLWMATQGCYLYKIDATTGDSLWRSKRFADQYGESTISSMAVKENDEVVVTASYLSGYTQSPYENDFYFLPANSDTLTEFNLQTNIPLILNDSKAIGDEILSVGYYYDPNCPSNTAYVVRFLPDGTVLSIVGQTFPFHCGFNKYVIDADNRLVILGFASYQNGTRNMLHSMSMEGDSIWTQFIGNDSIAGWDIKLAADGGYVVCGAKEETFSKFQPYMFKTNSLGVISNFENPGKEPDYSVYPNPAGESVVFEFPGIKSGTVTLTNTLGKTCAVIPIKSSRSVVNVENLERGLYLYTFMNRNTTLSGKLIVK